MSLPRINERKHESLLNMSDLKVELLKCIKDFEENSGYEFEAYEVDTVLLQMIERNHQSYLTNRFGKDTH